MTPRDYVIWFVVALTAISGTSAQDAALQNRVDELIQQLGSDVFRDRESAEAELESLGLLAFEPLQEVRNHPDIEIRLRARAMVSKLRKLFLTEGIDPILGQLVTNYESLTEKERELVANRVATHLPQQGLDVLSRIARFEDSDLLAKRAALSILNATVLLPADERGEWLQEVQEAAAISRRKSTVWMREFAAMNRISPEDLVSQWRRFIKEEKALLEIGSAETDADVVLDLERLHADLLAWRGGDSAARNELASQSFDTEQTVQDWLEWLQVREAWQSILDMQDVNEALFAGDRRLLYGLAEAHRRLGDEGAAAEIADRAFQMGGPTDAGTNEEDRLDVGSILEDERGQYDWAEREYRAAFEEFPQDELQAALAESTYQRYLALMPLAELLHDQQKELEAAEALRQIEDDAAEDKALLQFFIQLGRNPNDTFSRMHYFYAEHYRMQGDFAKQREHLEKGFRIGPTDADLLIGMFRFEQADDEWRAQVAKAIADASAEFRRQIRSERVDGSRMGLRSAGLAAALNQFAWLVANTIGDGHEALRYSQQSLELLPGYAGYLDTLARCHYNVGDIEEAVRIQTWAVRRSPYEGQLIRQLEFFQQARESDESHD